MMYWLTYLQKSRVAEDVACLLDYWAGAISTGVNLLQIVQLSTDEVSNYLKGDLLKLAKRVELGVPWREAFEQWEVARCCPELPLVGAIVEVSQAVGTDLSTALKRIALIIRTNQKIKRELNAISIQSRLTCLLLISIPPGLLLVMNVVTPDLLRPLWQTNSGRLALCVAGLLQVIGVFIVIRMLRMKWLA